MLVLHRKDQNIDSSTHIQLTASCDSRSGDFTPFPGFLWCHTLTDIHKALSQVKQATTKQPDPSVSGSSVSPGPAEAGVV